jgi:hypothetical protein
VTADSKYYTVEFENDIVRVLRVRLGAGDSTPTHTLRTARLSCPTPL